MVDHRRALSRYWLPLLAVLGVQLAAVSLLLRRAGVAPPMLYELPRVALQLGRPLAAALVARAIVERLRGRRPREALSRVLEAWWELPLVIAASVLLAEAYMWAKVMVPALNPTLWDRQLAALDRALCLGVDPNVAVLTVFELGPRWAATALDTFYGTFVTGMLAANAWFLTDRPARRRGFLVAVTVLWSAGFWLYVAVPALGPVYVDRRLWLEVRATFPVAARAQLELLANYRNVLAWLGGARVPISPTLGIAAMPSLHVAAHALFALWCHRLRSQWRAVFLATTILTFVGSVATGWHWMVDGLAGALLALAAAVAGGAVEPGDGAGPHGRG